VLLVSGSLTTALSRCNLEFLFLDERVKVRNEVVGLLNTKDVVVKHDTKKYNAEINVFNSMIEDRRDFASWICRRKLLRFSFCFALAVRGDEDDDDDDVFAVPFASVAVEKRKQLFQILKNTIVHCQFPQSQ